MTETPDNVTPLPQPGTTEARIMLNLDTLENESKVEPFSFIISGRQIVLTDPGDLDWQALDSLDDEREFLKLAMSEEDLEFFLAQKMPLWKMSKLGKAYQDHYGLEGKGA